MTFGKVIEFDSDTSGNLVDVSVAQMLNGFLAAPLECYLQIQYFTGDIFTPKFLLFSHQNFCFFTPKFFLFFAPNFEIDREKD